MTYSYFKECDILHTINDMASSSKAIQELLYIVPASRSLLAFPLLEGRGKLSTGLGILEHDL